MIRCKRFLQILAVTAGLALPPYAGSVRALTVFDPSNYAQNVLQAARALEQINNQIASLQHEVLMLQDMARNLVPLSHSELAAMAAALEQITALFETADGIAFDLAQTDAAWARFYPKDYEIAVDGDRLVQDARQRWAFAVDGLHDSLRLQAQVADEIGADRLRLDRLLAASAAADGNLAVSQATNELLALLAKQQLQIQALNAVQYRAQALTQAQAAIAQTQAQAQFERFMGTGPAYRGTAYGGSGMAAP
ncbi:MAG TPA: P-type conjugative transfer protein TrbJ [Ferrovibrio sp.]|uniref:P-type conjugative transfer protein TrbJ n=1 Tax=Ferrovibrio sp. TaxID=1917215 RepID=UPI002ED0FAFC